MVRNVKFPIKTIALFFLLLDNSIARHLDAPLIQVAGTFVAGIP